ncbi:MAG: OmpA family protein [Burkholderiaceae bacterium]|nr:OmpA family protein [Burkholderiaceae bacterium]
MRNASFLAIFLAVVCANAIAAPAAKTDHPLVSPYEGSTMRRSDVKEFDQYSAFTGMDEKGKEPTGLALEGKVTKLFYTKPKDRSILEVFRNYEDAVRAAGAKILYTCDQEKRECAAAYAGPTLQKYSGLHAISNLAGRYLLARFDQGGHTAYVAIAVGQTFTDVHVVEVKGMDTGMVKLDAAALGKGLDNKGYVVVDGIYFDTDKAVLQAQSKQALMEVAKLLKARPEMMVYVVGHTDMKGSFSHNQTLSGDRARAVVDELATNYGIRRDRMEGHGVGPLAPQATNASDSGRAENRRVVLVAR